MEHPLDDEMLDVDDDEATPDGFEGPELVTYYTVLDIKETASTGEGSSASGES
jgi:hypothetical protein